MSKMYSIALSRQDDSSVSSEDMNGTEPAWAAAEQPPAPEPGRPNGARLSNLAAAVKEDDGEAAGMLTSRLPFFQPCKLKFKLNLFHDHIHKPEDLCLSDHIFNLPIHPKKTINRLIDY